MAFRPSLEELLKGVPPAKLNQPCRDECLSELALSITNWQSIAPFLGLTEVDEKEISSSYPNELKRQIVAMLRKWKSKHGKKATYKRLARIFWKLAFTNVVEEICELLNSPDSSDSESDEARTFQPEAVSEQVQQPQSGVLNSYAQYLRGRYSARLPTFLTLQWPPLPTKKVFNLAMIVKERIQRPSLDEEVVRLTLRGNVDDIVARKTSVRLEKIFEHDRTKQKFVLVEGAPGAGKSTLAWHICQKWECGELFQEFRVVIFVQLRDPVIQEAKSLIDILPAKNEKMASDVVAQISACEGQGILFIVDSWDELPVRYQNDSIFERLICNPESLNLHLSTLLIASRPIASGKLQPLVSSRIEIVGFTKSEVKEYFDNALGDSDTVQKFQDQLAENPVIEAACYLPLNAAIIAHLFLYYQTLPNTLYGVFTSLVVSCITRHLTKLSGKGTWNYRPHIPSLDELPPEVENDFCSICLLAYWGIMENQVTFSSQVLQSFQPTPSSRLNTLCLIQGTESFQGSILYNFLHLQIQELLAAFHISKLPPGEQVKIFETLFGLPRFTAVFEFYAAFTRLETEGIRDIIANMVQGLTFDSKVALVSVLRCLYEAQDLSLCGYVISLLEGKLDLSDASLSPVDCLSVGYFLRCTCLTTTGKFEVNLRHGSLDDYKITCLVRELSKCCSDRHVKFEMNLSSGMSELHYGLPPDKVNLMEPYMIDLHMVDPDMVGRDMNPDVVQELPTVCSGTNPDMVDLDLVDPDVVDRDMNPEVHVVQELCSGTNPDMDLVDPNVVDPDMVDEDMNRDAPTTCTEMDPDMNSHVLQELDVPTIRSGTIKELLCCCSVISLDISRFHIEGPHLLSRALATNSSLMNLKLTCSLKVTHSNGPALTEMLTVNKTLQTLNVSMNSGVADVGTFFIAEGLLHNSGLKDLGMNNCDITARGAKSIADALKMNRTLKRLDISGNIIGGTGVVHIMEALKSNYTLSTLKLANLTEKVPVLQITDSNGPALTEMLTVNKMLQTLNMSMNSGVADVGAFFIAEGLLHNTGLKILELKYCSITAEGAKTLADALKVNRTLECLDIDSNVIGDAGIFHMAEALKSNNALKKLDLACCGLTEKGLTMLSASLVANNGLQYLDISTKLTGLPRGFTQTKPLAQKSLKQFVSCLQENFHLTKLILGLARDAPCRKDIVDDESLTLNQVRRDKGLPELDIVSKYYCKW